MLGRLLEYLPEEPATKQFNRATGTPRANYVWLGLSAFNGGIPIRTQLPFSTFSGADTIRGKLDALRFRDIAMYACSRKRARSSRMCGRENIIQSRQP